jgi:hypothetical protein
MARRATILTALVLCVCMASGAMAGDQAVIKKVTITPSAFDTASYVSGDVANKVNDSLWFNSPTFGMSKDVTAIVGKVLQTTFATGRTGVLSDTARFFLQTKVDHDSMTEWYTLWSSTLFPRNSFDTLDGWASLANATITVDTDSAETSLFDLYRVRMLWVVEEDTLRALDVSGIVTTPFTFLGYVIFREN